MRNEARRRVQPSGIAHQVGAVAAMSPAGERDQARAGIHPGVARSTLRDVSRENALTGADVQDLFARPRIEKFESCRDREGLVISTSELPDPAVVPGCDTLPAIAGASRASGTSLVPGHGRRTVA